MFVEDNKHRIDTLKRMLAVGKFIAKNEMSEVYELGHYIADNVLSKVCMLIGIEKEKEDLVYTNEKKNRTRDFKKLYEGILEFFYPEVPKYNDFVKKYHRDRSKYQHGLEHLDLKTIKKPFAIEYINFVEKIMKKIGYLGKGEVINPIAIVSSYTYNTGDYQKNSLEEKFKNLYNTLASDDLEHIHIDIKTILDEIGDKNLQKVLKMEYRILRSGYGDSMLIEYEKWNLNLNHAYRKSLYISKHNDRSYHYGEPDKNLDILQEFLEMIKERCKDAGLNIT